MRRRTDASVVLLKVTGALLGLFPLSFIVRSYPTILFKPLSEDGFYSLSVARNLATGHGLTIDGTHLTNGFQPAITVLDALAFLDHGNRVTGVRGVLILSWLVMVATCVVVAFLCRDLATTSTSRRVAPWVGVVAFLSGRYVLYAFNGLETGGEILVVALVWRYFQVRGVSRRSSALITGALLGLLILVRIDGIFLLAVVVGAILWERRSREGIILAAFVAAAAAVVSAPWWIYNQVTFGQLLPTSGQAEQSIRITTSRLPSLLIGVAQDVVPWGYTAKTQTFWFSVVEMVVVTVIVVLVGRRPKVVEQLTEVQAQRVRRGNGFAVIVSVATALLAIFYFVETDAVWFYGRYLAPALLVSSVAGVAFFLNRGFNTPRWLSVVAVVALIVGGAFTFHFDQGATSTYYSNQLSLINRYVPATDTVGAGQSGTIGFLRSHVVNLDGKVNQAALESQSNIRGYLASQHIVWVCDQTDYVTRYLSSDPSHYGWVLVAHQNGFELWHRVRNVDS